MEKKDLRAMDLDGKWLVEQLRQRKIAKASQVCLATVNKQRQLQIDLFDDVIPGMMDISEEDTPQISLDHIQITDKEKSSKNLF